MNRRDFNATMGASIISAIATNNKRSRVTSPILKKGDHIGLIAPAGIISDVRIQKAVTNMESLGLVPILGNHVYDTYGYLAGQDSDRLADLHRMYEDEAITAIWALRGGYGCTRIMEDINYRLIRRNSKPIIGYSDLTAMLLAVHKKTGQAGFHANIAATDWTDFTRNYIEQVFLEGVDSYQVPSIAAGPNASTTEPFVIKNGRASGRLVGGNLSLLVSLIGTPFAPKYKNKIVFIEDVGEKPYRLDRMLVQLMQATDIGFAAGIVIGHSVDCEAKEGEPSFTLAETLEKVFSHLDMPIYYGAAFGHIKDIAPIPIDGFAYVDTEGLTMTVVLQ